MAATEEPRASPYPGLLIVDDGEIIREDFYPALERHGFQVWRASDGLETIKIHARLHRFISVILLDLRLPDLEGPQVLTYLTQQNPKALVCFLVKEAGSYEDQILLNLGARYVFHAPVNVDQLANALLQLIDRAESQRPSIPEPHEPSQ